MTLTPDSIRLDGRVAAVTGAGSGIGAATALALARFGAQVAICDRDGDALADVAAQLAEIERDHLGPNGHACTGAYAVIDVRDAGATADWLESAASELGPIDILVNNAGGTFMADYLGLSANAEAALMTENYGQVASTTRAALAHWSEHGGSIVNVTSIEAHRAAPGFAAYAAAKAAVANLTKSLALELAPRRIRVNAVAPDVIATPGLGDFSQVEARAADRGEAVQPLTLPGTADDVAAAVVWLCSEMARFVTGTTVHVDGGTSAAAGWRRRLDDGGYTL